MEHQVKIELQYVLHFKLFVCRVVDLTCTAYRGDPK